METTTIISIIAYSVLFICELRVFFYQRTLRKLAIKYNLSNAAISQLYPTHLRFLYLFSRLKWVALILLFVFDWVAAVICLVVSYALIVVLPEQNDYKNLKTAKTVLEQQYYKGAGYAELNAIRAALVEALVECEG